MSLTKSRVEKSLMKSIEEQTGMKGCQFITKQQLCVYLQASPTAVFRLMRGVERMGNKYFIEDVAERISTSKSRNSA